TISAAGAAEARSCAEATMDAPANTMSDISMATSGGMPLATIATPVITPNGMMPRSTVSFALRMTCPGKRTCSASRSLSGSWIDLMLATGNRVSVPSASTIRYGLLMNSSSLSCLAAALAPCCGKPNEALVPSMKVIVSARLSSSDMGPPVAGGPILKLLLRRTPHLLAHAGAQSVAFLALARLARLVALRHPLLGLRIAFRRVLALRAQLLAHAVAALGVGLAFARL